MNGHALNSAGALLALFKQALSQLFTVITCLLDYGQCTIKKNFEG